jgi:hypothetical protein
MKTLILFHENIKLSINETSRSELVFLLINRPLSSSNKGKINEKWELIEF